MARRSFEMNFQIGGNLARSFSSSFSRASTSLSNLRNQSRQTQRALDQLGTDFRRGRIHQTQYAESTERLTRELQRLEHAQQRIKTMKSMIGSGFNTAKNVAGIAAVGTAALATGLAFKSMNTAADFQQQMAKVGAKAGASSAELKKLGADAQQLAPLAGGATNAAIAMDDLAAKGYNTNQIIQAMPGILNAANASGEDLALTSDTITSALETFGLKATKTSHVADVLAKTSNLTAAGMTDLQYTFKYAAAPAHALGISMEQLAAMTGVAANAGIKGETAGTALRGAMLRLVKPPKAAAKELKTLGVNVTDNHKKFRSFSDIIGDLNKSTAKMSNAQKTAALAQIFGTNAVSGMLTVIQAGKQKVDQFTDSLIKSDGASKKAADTMMNNYAGGLKKLKGSIESAEIKFATPILPVFQDVFNGINASLTKNMGGIENAGKRAASGLREIFEPFAVQKPTFDPRIAKDPEMLEQYRKKMAKFSSFDNMDFGDKVVYMLDETTKKMDQWLSGSGGKSMNKIFTKLGEIAGKAWWDAFKGAVSSTGSNVVNGNFASAGVTAVLAYMLGGKHLVKGAKNVAKYGYNKLKGRGAPRAVSTPVSGTRAASVAVEEQTTASRGLRTLRPRTLTEQTSVAAEGGGKAIFKKVLGPLGEVLMLKEAADGGNKLADWTFGHKKGSYKQKSLFSNPFDFTTQKYTDTRVGAVQKLFGYGNEEQSKKAITQPVPGNTNLTKLNTAALDKSATQLKSSFDGIKTSADTVKFNLDTLTSYTGQASGWMASLNGIQVAGKRVVKALENLEAKINSVQLPGGTKSKRVSFGG